jgi:hypothetical protein
MYQHLLCLTPETSLQSTLPYFTSQKLINHLHSGFQPSRKFRVVYDIRQIVIKR